MIHELKLYDENFKRLELGNKKREYRLYDKKRRNIRIGDTIKFIKLSDRDKYLYADVLDIEVFNNWYDCYSKYFEEDFKERYSSVDEVVHDTINGGYYTLEDSNKYGCVCITLSKTRKKI